MTVDDLEIRPHRVPIRRGAPLILPGLPNIYDFDTDSDEEKHNDILSNITTSTQRNLASGVLESNRKKKKSLKMYKENYKMMMQNIPTSLLKYLVSSDKCSICLNDHMEFNTDYVMTSCFHTFHENCIKNSLEINDNCPLCRKNLKSSYYKKFQVNVMSKGVDTFE